MLSSTSGIRPTGFDYLSALERHWSFLLVMGALAVLLTYLFSASVPRLFEASIVLDPSRNSGVSEAYLATQIHVVKSDEVAGQIAQKFGLGANLSGLEVIRQNGTSLLQIRYRHTDPNVAVEVVRAIADASFILMHGSASSESSTYAVYVGPSPVVPETARNCLYALFFSTFASAFAVLLLQPVDARLRRLDHVAKVTLQEAICVVPTVKAWRRWWIPSNPAPRLFQADKTTRGNGYGEAVQKLTGAFLAANQSEEPFSLLIASPQQHEGRSTLAANLAAALSDAGKRILLINGDLHHRDLDALFTPVEHPLGLANALVGEADWRDLLSSRSAYPLLQFLAAGTAKVGADLPMEKLHSLLAEARADFDFILVDSPPLLEFSHTIDWICALDGVVLVARRNRTTQSALLSTLAYLRRLDVHPFGVVFNDA